VSATVENGTGIMCRASACEENIMSVAQQLCVALDGSDREWIVSSAHNLAGRVGWLKIGLEAFVAHGPKLVEAVADTGAKVFLDLKLHDIPATVRRAATNCASSGAGMLTVHAGGGHEMIEAAVEGIRAAGADKRVQVVAVTVLTSLDQHALSQLGLDRSPADLVARWSRMAERAGAAGVVASAHEAAAVRSLCGQRFLIVTPGIRPAGQSRDDQRRVVTPGEALRAGSSMLVVGRPVTRSDDPVAAVESILAEMADAT
jgi:orotidine-5'-phosphate decarboxylase